MMTKVKKKILKVLVYLKKEKDQIKDIPYPPYHYSKVTKENLV